MAETLNEELIDSLEKKMEDLRNQFEQYFMGTRIRPPEQERTTVQFIIRRQANQSIPNTRLRFRFQQLVAKFNSYNQYWNRTLQQIEAGTYFRARFKAQLHSGAIEPPKGSRPKKQESESHGVSDEHIDQVYDAFIEARKSLKQSTDVSRDKIAASIKKQMPALQERYKGKRVEFKVVVEGGKAKLKATIK